MYSFPSCNIYLFSSYLLIPEVQPEIWNVWLEVAGRLGSQRWFGAGSKSDFTQLFNICYKSPFAHSPPSVLRMNEQNGLTPVHLHVHCFDIILLLSLLSRDTYLTCLKYFITVQYKFIEYLKFVTV